MVSKFLFIVNPTAGQGKAGQAVPEIISKAKEINLDYELVQTKQPGHAIEIAQSAAINKHEYIISVGGDGTANEVLNGMMRAWGMGYRDSRMGIIGIGRGNDFAFAYAIPAGLEQGFSIIQQNKLHPMDVGMIFGGDYPDGRYFGNGVGIGFDAVVGFEAAKLVHLHGFINYVVAALKTIFLFFRAPTVKIEYDQNILTQPSLMVSIMNGRRMGGGFMMAPDASTDDGLLDLCIAGQTSKLGILRLIPKFMKGNQASSPQIKMGRANKVHVIAQEGVLPAHADGETICVAGKELTVEIIKNPIMILHG
jgi:YegS/Rv2252/BmrU family lipid kinase